MQTVPQVMSVDGRFLSNKTQYLEITLDEHPSVKIKSIQDTTITYEFIGEVEQDTTYNLNLNYVYRGAFKQSFPLTFVHKRIGPEPNLVVEYKTTNADLLGGLDNNLVFTAKDELGVVAEDVQFVSIEATVKDGLRDVYLGSYDNLDRVGTDYSTKIKLGHVPAQVDFVLTLSHKGKEYKIPAVTYQTPGTPVSSKIDTHGILSTFDEKRQLTVTLTQPRYKDGATTEILPFYGNVENLQATGTVQMNEPGSFKVNDSGEFFPTVTPTGVGDFTITGTYTHGTTSVTGQFDGTSDVVKGYLVGTQVGNTLSPARTSKLTFDLTLPNGDPATGVVTSVTNGAKSNPVYGVNVGDITGFPKDPEGEARYYYSISVGHVAGTITLTPKLKYNGVETVLAPMVWTSEGTPVIGKLMPGTLVVGNGVEAHVSFTQLRNAGRNQEPMVYQLPGDVTAAKAIGDIRVVNAFRALNDSKLENVGTIVSTGTTAGTGIEFTVTENPEFGGPVEWKNILVTPEIITSTLTAVVEPSRIYRNGGRQHIGLDLKKDGVLVNGFCHSLTVTGPGTTDIALPYQVINGSLDVPIIPNGEIGEIVIKGVVEGNEFTVIATSILDNTLTVDGPTELELGMFSHDYVYFKVVRNGIPNPRQTFWDEATSTVPQWLHCEPAEYISQMGDDVIRIGISNETGAAGVIKLNFCVEGYPKDGPIGVDRVERTITINPSLLKTSDSPATLSMNVGETKEFSVNLNYEDAALDLGVEGLEITSDKPEEIEIVSVTSTGVTLKSLVPDYEPTRVSETKFKVSYKGHSAGFKINIEHLNPEPKPKFDVEIS